MNKTGFYLVTVAFLALAHNLLAQSAYQPLGTDAYWMVDRMEIKSGSFLPGIFTSSKPYTREDIVKAMKSLDTLKNKPHWSKVDSLNFQWLKTDNSEWADDKVTQSQSPILKYFYTSKANLYDHTDSTFMIKVDPIVNLGYGKDENSTGGAKYINARGLEFRGWISKKVGFYFNAVETDLAPPDYADAYIKQYGEVPGAGYFKYYKTNGYDFLTSQGYIDFKIIKYLNVNFGVGNNFIGDGERSLFLSNFSDDYLYLKLSLKVWKFQYDCIFMQGIESYHQTAPDSLLPKRYAAMHYLTLNATKWLNLGLFEGIIFSRTTGYELQYLNPIILYYSAQQSLGSPDNSVLGASMKINMVKHVQLYGQLLIDDLNLSQTKIYGVHYWGDKYALQGGIKYIDAFMINNLDLQLEANMVRPYTYAHQDSVSSYTNYNLPLADPLGANFEELIGIIHFQPVQKFYITAKAFIIKSGADIDTINYGGNIIRPTYEPEAITSTIGQGLLEHTLLGTLTLSYEVRHNIFIDLDFIYRKQTEAATGALVLPTTEYAMLGLRWNIAHRDYDF